MDQLKNLANKAGGGSGSTAQQPAAGGAQKEDYVDKGELFSLLHQTPPPSVQQPDGSLTRLRAHTAFDMGMKKSGHNVDRNTSEKITDGARSAYEKVTGKQVNPKISN